MAQLMTANQVADQLGCSRRTITRLIREADTLGHLARWQIGREIVDLSQANQQRRTLRFDINKILSSTP